MNKDKAIGALGGLNEAANAIGITPQAIRVWPDPLPSRIADRVIAALVRSGKPIPPELMDAAPASNQSEAA